MFFDEYEDEQDNPNMLAPFVPTDEAIGRAMLTLGQVNDNDVVYDLGSGDGAIVVQAAVEFGARAVGIELNPVRIDEGRDLAHWAGVQDKVSFIEADLQQADIRNATVVALYLLPSVHLALKPKLLNELNPGTRILTHSFDLGTWRPDQQVDFGGIGVFKWVVPEKVAGTWQWRTKEGDEYRVALEQKFQQVAGKAWCNDTPMALTASLRGRMLELRLQGAEKTPEQRFLFRCMPNSWRAMPSALPASDAEKVA